MMMMINFFTFNHNMDHQVLYKLVGQCQQKWDKPNTNKYLVNYAD